MNLILKYSTFVIFSIIISLFLLGILSAQPTEGAFYQFNVGDPGYQTALAIVAAQEAGEALNEGGNFLLDEEFNPEDFGKNSVGILPTSPFYFLKNARRALGSFFTVDDINEAKRRLGYTSEKLLEAVELSKQEGIDDSIVLSALENFRSELERAKNDISLASQGSDSEREEELADSMLDLIFKYEKMLGGMESRLSPENFNEIDVIKDETADTFGHIFDLVEEDAVPEIVTKIMEEQNGSEFKHFKNLEVLKDIREQTEGDRRAIILVTEENILNRLHNDLETSDVVIKALFEDFTNDVGGNEVRHLEILNDLDVQPLSEELRKIISAAEERVLARTEIRMSSFISPELKEKYLGHLTSGDLNDIRILRELKNNISKNAAGGVVDDLQNRAKNNFASGIKDIGNDPIKKEAIIKQTERFHDVKSIATFDEIRDLIPEESLGIFEELRERAVQEMRKDVENARDQVQKEIIYKALAGDHPEEFKLLDDFEADTKLEPILRGILDGLRSAQFSRMEERVGHINDESRFRIFEESFKENEGNIRNTSSNNYGRIEDLFRDKQGVFGSQDRALKVIKEAEDAISQLRTLVNSLPFESGFNEQRGFDREIGEIERLLLLAERKLEKSRTVLDYNDVGRAFGEATAALSIAKDAIRYANDYKTGNRRVVKPPEFLPQDFYETHTTGDDVNYVPPPEQKQSFDLYNKYEFNQFCAYVGGFSKESLLCSFPDGRVFDARGQNFPIRVPAEFVPRRVSPRTPDGKPLECPLSYSPSVDFCRDGVIEYRYDARGCMLAPECVKKTDIPTTGICPEVYPKPCPDGSQRKTILTENGCRGFGECISEGFSCGGLIDLPCPQGYRCEAPDAALDVPGKCVPLKQPPLTCTAFFEGWVFDTTKKECFYRSTSACSDPYLYDTRNACEGANGIDGEPTHTYYCGNEICDPDESSSNCPFDCKGTSSWVEHIWNFADGTSEKSFVLSRQDSEYLNYLNTIDAQCKNISKSKFYWKQFSGDDRPENWKNFGIPDCSGKIPTIVCGNSSCEAGETSATCPADCGSTPTNIKCDNYISESTCRAYSDCIWSSTTGGSSGLCKVRDFGTYCGDNMCNGSETLASCPSDCGSTPTSGNVPIEVSSILPGAHEHSNVSGVITYLGSNEDSFVVWNSNSKTTERIGKCSTDTNPPNGCTEVSSPTSSCSGKSESTCVAESNCKWYQDSSNSYCYFESSETCGNNFCGFGENSNSCPSDCGGYTCVGSSESSCLSESGCYWNSSTKICSSSGTSGFCGNNFCESNESSASCPSDCSGTSTSNCPSGFHTHPENGGYCMNDQENYSGTCYDNAGTTVISCPTQSTSTCNNNGVCDSGETQDYCPSDCGRPAAYCGDYICDSNESSSSCASDCGSGTQSCYTISDQSSCLSSSSGCVWYTTESGHNDTHCDDAAHGGSSGSSCATAGACTSQTQCSSSGFYWYNGTCNNSYEQSCSSTASSCSSNSECLSYGYYWCNGTCYFTGPEAESAGCSSTSCTNTPNLCTDQSTCTSSGYSWCDTYCQSGSCPSTNYCGDGTCDSNESTSSCSTDCGAPPSTSVCGDGACSYPDENESSCPADCTGSGGDGSCNTHTTIDACQNDSSGCTWDAPSSICYLFN